MNIPPEVRKRLNIHGEAYLKLKKALYGLKQASRNWYQTLCQHILQCGYIYRSKLDNCMFFQSSTDSKLWMVVYVDDMAIAVTYASQLDVILELLRTRFKVTCKPLQRYLGLEVDYDVDKQILKFHLQSYIKHQVTHFEDLLGIFKQSSSAYSQNA